MNKAGVNIILALIFAFVQIQAKTIATPKDISVQVKVYDLKLEPAAGLSLKIDELPLIRSNERGIAFVTVADNAMPPRNIVVESEELEVESWNYSKGILEIIIRKKSYRQVGLSVIDPNNKPIGRVSLKVSGLPNNPYVTNNSGKLSLKLPLAINLGQKDLFELQDFHIVQRRINDDNIVIVAAPIIQESFQDMNLVSIQSNREPQEQAEQETINLDLEDLDSITSLTVMYALMQELNFLLLDSITKKRLDTKITELISENSRILARERDLTTLISDSSIINDDLLQIREKIRLEEELMNSARIEFQMFTEQIEAKLKDGGQNLNTNERKQLIELVLKLQEMLKRNESLFYSNTELYRNKLDGLLSQLANIHELEDMLSQSEQINSRTKEQLLYAFFIFASFIGVIMLLIFLVKTLKNQRAQLSNANREITRINSNLEHIVAEKTKSLELINAELDTFLYRSSHNLKRPLTSIRGLASIAEVSLSREAIGLFEKVVSTTAEMEKMLDKLTMMNHINQPVNFGEIDIDSIVERLRDQYQKIIEENNITFNVRIQDGIKFRSFPAVIEIMITNLLENAFFFCKYNVDRNPKVELSFNQDSRNHLVITVADNGSGIDKEVQKKMWDMFFIGNDVSKGSGLGLFIAKKAIDALLGKIRVTSVMGEYSKFSIKLPIIKKNTRVIRQNKEAVIA